MKNIYKINYIKIILFFVYLFISNSSFAQTEQCIITGTVFINQNYPPSGSQINLLKNNHTFIRSANYNADNGHFGVNAFSSDGLKNGDTVLFQVVTDRVIDVYTYGDPPIYHGNVLPYPPYIVNLNLYYQDPINLLYPDSAATNLPIENELSWSSAANAEKYYLQIAKDNYFTNIVIADSSLTTTHKHITSLSYNTKYYWRVRVNNVGGTSAWTSPWTFTTKLTPILISPLNGAINQPLSLSLSWAAFTGASTYRVEVATDSLFTTLIINDSTVSINSKAISGLINSAKYFWRVNAKNIGGTSPYSSVFNFTTIVAAPDAPTLIYPANNAILGALKTTLKWSPVTSATSFKVQFATDANFTTPIVDTVVPSDSLAISSLKDNTQYFWRVYSINDGGQTVSSIFNFSVHITGIREDLRGIPKLYSLDQNYPNPYNPSTKINYTIPFESRVTLEVYNITGERISLLVNEEQSAGFYSVNFNSASLNKNISSGIYFYRMTVVNKATGNNFTAIKKMVLMK